MHLGNSCEQEITQLRENNSNTIEKAQVIIIEGWCRLVVEIMTKDPILLQ